MSITYSKQLSIGVSAAPIQQVLLDTNDTQATVLTAGYLSQNLIDSGIQFNNKQIASVYTTDGGMGVYKVVVADGIVSLEQGDDNPNAVMSAGASLVNYIAKYMDLTGKLIGPVGQATGPAINLGDIYAGQNGLSGKFISVAPSAGRGTLNLQAANNGAAYTTTIINNSHGQNTNHMIPDIGLANDAFLTTAILTPDANANLVRFDTTITTTTLASAGIAPLFVSSGTKQYKIVALWLNSGSNLLVGNRNITLSDGTTSYSVIPSASLLALANAAWGATALPFPAAAALNTSTVAGASLQAQYSGGTTDYTTGENITISGILQRVA